MAETDYTPKELKYLATLHGENSAEYTGNWILRVLYQSDRHMRMEKGEFNDHMTSLPRHIIYTLTRTLGDGEEFLSE